MEGALLPTRDPPASCGVGVREDVSIVFENGSAFLFQESSRVPRICTELDRSRLDPIPRRDSRTPDCTSK
jgi:hypothetical protein